MFDACVLYPAPVRDLLVRLSGTGLFRAHWTADIQQEWMRNLRKDRADISQEALERTAAMMVDAVPDCLVTGHEQLIGGLTLPDSDDRHVLAAAIVARAQVIVTYNLKDFPPETLAQYGVQAQHPDEFVHHLIDLSAPSVCEVVRDQRAALKNPPLSLDELLNAFLRAQLNLTVAALKPMGHLL